MSLNTSQSKDGLGVVLFYGERLLITYDGCKLSLSGKSPAPSGKYNGHAFLTSHRVVFLSKDSSNVKSLSMPFVYIKGLEIKQPTFGPNHLEGFVLPESGQWEGRLPWKLQFNHGGAIEFGKSLYALGSRASKLQSSYKMPSATPACEIYACPPPAYTPFAQDAYYSSFMVPHDSFGQPNPNQLYQTNAPPPYPGVVPPAYNAAPEMGATNYGPAAPYPPQAPPSYGAAVGGPGYPPGPPMAPGAAYGGPPMAPYPPPTGQVPPVNNGYYYPQDPNTVYAPPYNQASAPPMEPEDKKNM